MLWWLILYVNWAVRGVPRYLVNSRMFLDEITLKLVGCVSQIAFLKARSIIGDLNKTKGME